MKPSSVLETCLYVDDLEAAEQFYRDVLGLEFVNRQERRHVFFRCGDGMLLIFDPQASNETDATLPPHGSVGAGHVAFRIREHEIDAWRRHLQSRGVAVERVLDWPQGGQSLYFRDPAGNSLEVASPRIWGIDE